MACIIGVSTSTYPRPMRKLRIAEHIFLSIDLDASGLVANIDEHAFAHVAMSGDAAGDCYLVALNVVGTSVSAFLGGDELVFERIDAFGSQGGELGFALLDK